MFQIRVLSLAQSGIILDQYQRLKSPIIKPIYHYDPNNNNQSRFEHVPFTRTKTTALGGVARKHNAIDANSNRNHNKQRVNLNLIVRPK
jgi:hypothetical protein